jgi:hypothetical protein
MADLNCHIHFRRCDRQSEAAASAHPKAGLAARAAPDGASCARPVEIPLQSSVSDQFPMLRSMLVVGYSGDYPILFAPLGSGLGC